MNKILFLRIFIFLVASAANAADVCVLRVRDAKLSCTDSNAENIQLPNRPQGSEAALRYQAELIKTMENAGYSFRSDDQGAILTFVSK